MIADLGLSSERIAHAALEARVAAIASAKGDMRALQAATEKALADARAGTVGHMATHNRTVKGGEEQQRAAAGVQMQTIFATAQHAVDQALQQLNSKSVERWKAGIESLSTAFENSLAHVKQEIDKRHSGKLGWLRSLKDSAVGLPDWVTEDYDRAETAFANGATDLVRDISRDVNAIIDSCQKLIHQARQDIETIASSLPASLQTWAHGEAARLGTQLDQLHTKVDQSQHNINRDLINRANGAVQQVRERVADLREEAKGLIGKIADAIAEFIKDPGKAIINGLLRILNIPPPRFWALVDKLSEVIGGIAAEPKKFANTLMAGVGKGFEQFFDHLPMHLGQALFEWLFSKLGEAGVQMPTDFSVKSILTLILEIMGITWTRIKTLIAKHIGAENAELFDHAIQLVSTLMAQGPAGVFEMIKEHLDPSMIIDAIKDAAIQFVMQAIITRVTARILMMLNPVGAILQAIEAIYRVIKWVIDNAARIFTLIESIVNGAAMILAGNTSGVAALVESSLVKLLVPVIDFLAGYLGLGGIPNAIKNVILGLQAKVEAILDKVIGFLVTKAKALWQAIKSKVTGKDGQKESSDKKDDDKAGKVGKVVNFTGAGESHEIWVEQVGDRAEVKVASAHKMPVTERLADFEARYQRGEPHDPAARIKARELLDSTRPTAQQAQQDANKLVSALHAARAATAEEHRVVAAGGRSDVLEQGVEQKEDQLAVALAELYDLFAVQADPERQPKPGPNIDAKHVDAIDPAADPPGVVGMVTWSRPTRSLALAIYPKDVHIGGLPVADRYRMRGAPILRLLRDQINKVLGEQIRQYTDKFPDDAAEIRTMYAIDGVEGIWGGDSTNLTTFNFYFRTMPDGDPKEWCRATFTGTQARRDFGFTTVTIDVIEPDFRKMTPDEVMALRKQPKPIKKVHCVFTP